MILQKHFASFLPDAARRLSFNALGLTVHGLRHGGASEDKARSDRTLLEIQQKGAWQSFSEEGEDEVTKAAEVIGVVLSERAA